MNTSDNSFEERNFKNKVDAADEKFIARLNARGVKYKKIGPDPKDDYVEDYWLIGLMYDLPDYIVWAEDGDIYFTEVKGTNKIKSLDYRKLENMYNRSLSINEYSKKKIHVGIAYIKNPTYNSKVKWIPYPELKDKWKQKEYQEYKGETELDGTPKYYKQLDL